MIDVRGNIMKRVRNTWVFVIIFAVMAVSILAMHYSLNLDLRRQPPSDEWSKEVLISRGKQNEATKPYPRIIRFGSNYIIAHQNEDSIKLLSVDKLGKKINEKSIKQDDDLIRYISLLSDDENIYLGVVRFGDSGRIMNYYKLDKDFNIIENSEIDNVDSSAQIANNILITAYTDRIEVYDVVSKRKLVHNVRNAKFVSGIETGDKYLISYQESNKYFKYFFINSDFTISEVNLAGTMAPDEKGFFERVNLACDNEFGYIFVDVKSSEDRFGTIKYLQFSFDGKVKEVKEFRQYPFRQIYSPIAVSSGDNARFIAGSSRQFGKKEEQYDIIEFYFKDGKMTDYAIASRTKEASVYPAAYDDTIIFMDSTGNGYDIYMASKNEEFKNANNYPRPYESKIAFSDMITGFMFSITYTFVYGIRWIIVGLVCIAAVSYFAYNMRDKTKKIAFSIVYLITTIAKLYSVYTFFYINYLYMIPDIFVSPILGLSISLFISLVCWIYGINRYRRNLESIPIASFSYALLIDSVMTQMIFVPFIA